MPYKDPEIRREYNKNYRMKHKQRLKKQEREYYQKNKEKKKKYAKKYYREHEDESREYRLENKDRIVANNKRIQREIFNFIQQYKQQHRCSICGEKDPRVLAFHHRNGEKKEFAIGNAPNRHVKRERLMKEINKCTLLCINCHRKVHS